MASSYDPSQEFPYTYFPMEAETDLSKLDLTITNLDIFVLLSLTNIIQLEEKQLDRLSGLRVFCRLDMSIFQEQDSGEHHYFVNKIMRTHSAALCPHWDTNNRLNYLFTHMSNILHHMSKHQMYKKLGVRAITPHGMYESTIFFWPQLSANLTSCIFSFIYYIYIYKLFISNYP